MRVSKRPKVHFLTAYLEYLFDQGIRSEYYYFADASRYIRFLINQSDAKDVEAFLGPSPSPSYRKRLRKTLRKFYSFAEEELGHKSNPLH